MEGDISKILSSDDIVSKENKRCQETVVIKKEYTPEVSSNFEQKSDDAEVSKPEVIHHIKCENNDLISDTSEMESVLTDWPTEAIEQVETEEFSATVESIPIDVKVNELKVESLPEDLKDDKFNLNNVASCSSPVKESACSSPVKESVTDVCEKSSVDAESKVTLKRKSDSLALISSYQISSESEEDVNRDAFLKPQVLSETETESDSDSESDGLPVFNIDSDVASESGDEGIMVGSKQKKSNRGIKAPGELDVDDLPPIKDLQISVKEEECLPFGKVHSIVETLVVIEALPDVPAINLESVLFTKIGQPLGEIFDVFGPVKRPYYTIRFNSRNDIEAKSLSVGSVVYCAPKTKYTQYVFIHQLAKMKGSDASWKGDLEPPPGYEEFSDDEEERKVKKERKEARMKALAQEIIDIDEPPKKVSFEERMNRQNTIRNQLFSNHLMTPPKRPDWFKNAAPGAGRPKPEGEGSSKGNVVRAPNFTVPSFQRRTPPAPSFPFSPGNSFRLPPPPTHIFPMRNNQIQPKLFSSPSSGNIFSPQSWNGSPFSVNRPQSPFSPNGQGFQQTNPTYQASGQNFSPNSQAFQRSTPFQPMVGGFQPSNQGWASNNHTFGGQPSFPSNAHSFPTSCPSFNASNSPGFSPSHLCKHRHFDSQGLQSKAQPFPQNNPTFSSSAVGNFQQSRFIPDSPQFPHPPNKPFPQLFQQNSPQFSSRQSQNFHRSPNPPFSLPNSRPFPGNSPPFQTQNHFSPPNQQGPQFIQNGQFFSTNIPSYQPANSPPFPTSSRSFPPK